MIAATAGPGLIGGVLVGLVTGKALAYALYALQERGKLIAEHGTEVYEGMIIGENARASLITRGLAELVRLGIALGGEARTFYGLSGLGDLVATCSSVRSRNHQAGVRLAAGESLEDLQAWGLTAEGIPTVKAVHDSDVGRSIDLPISREVYKVLFERKDPRQGIVDLLTRAERAE